MSLVYFNGDEEIEIFNDNSFCSSGKILGIFDFCKWVFSRLMFGFKCFKYIVFWIFGYFLLVIEYRI